MPPERRDPNEEDVRDKSRGLNKMFGIDITTPLLQQLSDMRYSDFVKRVYHRYTHLPNRERFSAIGAAWRAAREGPRQTGGRTYYKDGEWHGDSEYSKREAEILNGRRVPEPKSDLSAEDKIHHIFFEGPDSFVRRRASREELKLIVKIIEGRIIAKKERKSCCFPHMQMIEGWKNIYSKRRNDTPWMEGVEAWERREKEARERRNREARARRQRAAAAPKEEYRYDKDDAGNYGLYTKEQFRHEYDTDAEFNRAIPEVRCEDGRCYTLKEFREFYGDVYMHKWGHAKPPSQSLLKQYIAGRKNSGRSNNSTTSQHNRRVVWDWG